MLSSSRLLGKTWYSTATKHFFTKPEVVDTKHFFSSPGPRKTKRFLYLLLGLSVGSASAYSSYKLYIQHESLFVPFWRAPKLRPLSIADSRRIDSQHVEALSRLRVLEKLSQHPLIKEKYGVPLHSKGMFPVTEFKLYCEDQDPCFKGLYLTEDRASEQDTLHSWHRIPHVLRWRVGHKPLSISRWAHDHFHDLWLQYGQLFEIVPPESFYNSFKNEYALSGDGHAVHIWFLGQLELDDNSFVVFKGKFHFDAKLQQLDLLQKDQNGKLVRYVLYKDG